jgi:hypothetical protein
MAAWLHLASTRGSLLDLHTLRPDRHRVCRVAATVVFKCRHQARLSLAAGKQLVTFHGICTTCQCCNETTALFLCAHDRAEQTHHPDVQRNWRHLCSLAQYLLLPWVCCADHGQPPSAASEFMCKTSTKDNALVATAEIGKQYLLQRRNLRNCMLACKTKTLTNGRSSTSCVRANKRASARITVQNCGPSCPLYGPKVRCWVPSSL